MRRRRPSPSDPSTSATRSGNAACGRDSRGLGRESDAPEAGFLDRGEGAGEVGDPEERDDLEGPGGRLGERPGFRGGMPLGDQDPGGPEGSGRTQHGAHILRIADLVQHQKCGRPFRVELGEDIFQRLVGQRLDQGRHALMHCPARQ